MKWRKGGRGRRGKEKEESRGGRGRRGGGKKREIPFDNETIVFHIYKRKSAVFNDDDVRTRYDSEYQAGLL